MAGRRVEAPTFRCAIYTRKSTEEGLAQEFNSLDAQREACEAYIESQRGEGWCAPYEIICAKNGGKWLSNSLLLDAVLGPQEERNDISVAVPSA
jgi:hypothetical protein